MTAYTCAEDLFRDLRQQKKETVSEYRTAQEQHLRLTGAESELLKQHGLEVIAQQDAKLDRLGRQHRQYRDLMALTDTELRMRSANEYLGLAGEDESVQRRTLAESDCGGAIGAIFKGNEIKKEWDGIQALAEEYVTIKNDTGAGTAAYNRTQRQIDIVNSVVTSVMPYICRIAQEMRLGRYDKKTGTYGHGPVRLFKNWTMAGKQADGDELIQDGAMNIVEKFGTYDPGRARFSTWLVRNALAGMTKGFGKYQNHIQLGHTLWDHARKVLRRHPSREDFISAITDKSTEELFELHRGISPARAALIYLTLTGRYMNIWESRRRDSDSPSVGPLETVLADEDAQMPEEEVESSQLSDKVRAVLASLTPRQEKVLRMRFGIGTNYDRTIEEVSQDFDVTSERIRQIEANALSKLRHPSQCMPVRDFAE